MKLKIISSTKTIFEGEEVSSLYVPGGAGAMQILPMHANLVSTLSIGEVSFTYNSNKEEYFLNGGFIVVKKDEILILADDVQAADELVSTEINEAITKAEQKISSGLAPSELIQLEKQLRYERFKRERLTR